jgi:hypothetical protein
MISAWGDRMWMFAVGLFMVSRLILFNQYFRKFTPLFNYLTGRVVTVRIVEMAGYLRTNKVAGCCYFGFEHRSLD